MPVGRPGANNDIEARRQPEWQFPTGASLHACAQLASETLILREEIIRSKSDNKDMDAALAAAQQEARAAIARAAACEEAFQPLLAELGTLKVAAMMADDAAEIGAKTPACMCLALMGHRALSHDAPADVQHSADMSAVCLADNMPTNTGGVMAAQALQDAQYQGDSDDHGFVLDMGGYNDGEIGK